MFNGPTPRAASVTERATTFGGPASGRIDRRQVLRISGAATLLPLLAACGAMPPAGTATPPSTAPGTPAAPAAPTSAAPAKKGITIGDLADRVDASWPKVTSYRETATQFVIAPLTLPGAATPLATPGATPMATPAPAALTTVRAVIVPNQRSQRVSGAGAFDHEAVVIGDRLAARGPLVPSLVPGAPADAWVAIDPATLKPDDPAAAPLLALLRLPAGPPVSFPERLRDQVVRPLGAIPVSGHSCEGYALADTSATGQRLDITLALDDNNRPCLRETRFGRILLERVVWDQYDAVPPIVWPLPAGATPAASPVASAGATPLATSLAHD